ncbi:MAG TPA: xylose operon transcription regulator XylR, partial [Lacipirellulaceae bacterium]|nr:xylose operon transcription regulator XylR [Lacipirellulaceae bacterium]
MRELPKVALLVETSRGFGREMLRGIARYAQLHGPWSFHITAGDFEQAVPKMKQWGGAGIIARIPNERVARAILDAEVPTIALGLTDEQMEPGHPLSQFCELSSDANEVARIAAEPLLERRFRHYAYVGLDH